MKQLLAFAIRNPRRAAILTGIAITLLLSIATFPSAKTVEDTVEGWLPPNNVSSGPAADRLRTITAETPGLQYLSEEAFRVLSPAASIARTRLSEDGRDFVVEYVGATGDAVFLAERTIERRPWWSPERYVYRALRSEVQQATDALRLTYTRDLEGLVLLLLFDVAVGIIYGMVVGALFAVLSRTGLSADSPLPHRQPQLLPQPRGRTSRA